MNSNRVKEIKKEDKKAFKSFIIIMIISAIAGGILGGMSIYFKDSLSENEKVIDEPIEVDGQVYHMTGVSMGNPHTVIYVDDVKNLDLEKIGPKFENHERFPKRINTEFVHCIDRNTVEMRVWERGSGETLACGTGACAVAVASILNNLTDTRVTVKLLGGDLQIEWDREKNHVFMTGPAKVVFDGVIDITEIK